MLPLTLKDLKEAFEKAKELNLDFVAVEIAFKNLPSNEVIINPIENIDDKLEYYLNTYDENLNHKFADGVSIVDFTFGKSFHDIQDNLGW